MHLNSCRGFRDLQGKVSIIELFKRLIACAVGTATIGGNTEVAASVAAMIQLSNRILTLDRMSSS